MSDTEIRAGRLDVAKLGEAFLRMPLVATQLGHTTMEKVHIYVHPGEDLETQFVVDFLRCTSGHPPRGFVDEFNAKWFGGEAGARALIQAVYDAKPEAVS